MMEHNPWKILHEKNIYQNAWISVTEFDVTNPNGGTGIYGKVHFKNTAVGVMVLDNSLHTYLVGQYRFPLGAYSWEIPEGGSPVGSDPLENGKRELLEETGLAAAQWQPLLQMHLSNSVSDEMAVVFLATGLTQYQPEPEQTEQLLVRKLPFEEAYRMVNRGEITDSMSVAAIIKIKLMLLEGSLK